MVSMRSTLHCVGSWLHVWSRPNLVSVGRQGRAGDASYYGHTNTLKRSPFVFVVCEIRLAIRLRWRASVSMLSRHTGGLSLDGVGSGPLDSSRSTSCAPEPNHEPPTMHQEQYCCHNNLATSVPLAMQHHETPFRNVGVLARGRSNLRSDPANKSRASSRRHPTLHGLCTNLRPRNHKVVHDHLTRHARVLDRRERSHAAPSQAR